MGSGSDSKWVEVPDTTVAIESGAEAFVPRFVVARRWVTVGEYDAFVKASGYVTTAERAGDSVRFDRHHALRELRPDEARDTPATQLSWNDAVAYCSFAGGTLMTESQWLAASVRDWSSTIDDPSWAQSAAHLAEVDTARMLIEGPEWTRSGATDGERIVRSRPRYVLTPMWRMERQLNSLRLPRSYYNDVIGFRVCC
jgi:hypothetical protein